MFCPVKTETMSKVKIQKEYKDRLFTFLFGSEEHKDWTLSLYNAVNGSDYTDPEKVRITTIKDVLYLGMHNDVSFQISDEMNLYEQQSSFNPNMPLRQMQYAGNLFEQYIKEQKRNKFGTELIRLPVPKLITFYNGRTEEPDERILELKDSFPEGSDPDIYVRVRMININYGQNKELLIVCRPLREYSWLIGEIRKNKQDGISIETAVNKAITDMPDDFVIRPLLEAHRAEVLGMLLTEYDEAEAMELFKLDGKREGIKEGIKEGRESSLMTSIQNLMHNLNMTCDQAMEALGVPINERAELRSRF